MRSEVSTVAVSVIIIAVCMMLGTLGGDAAHQWMIAVMGEP